MESGLLFGLSPLFFLQEQCGCWCCLDGRGPALERWTPVSKICCFCPCFLFWFFSFLLFCCWLFFSHFLQLHTHAWRTSLAPTVALFYQRYLSRNYNHRPMFNGNLNIANSTANVWRCTCDCSVSSEVFKINPQYWKAHFYLCQKIFGLANVHAGVPLVGAQLASLSRPYVCGVDSIIWLSLITATNSNAGSNKNKKLPMLGPAKNMCLKKYRNKWNGCKK